MSNNLDEPILKELLRAKAGGQLYHRESTNLEFKENFNFAGLGDYLRDFAAFANNAGGHLIFGVTNSPRKAKGLSAKAAKAFDNIDEATISGHLNENFSPAIVWERTLFEYKGKKFGAIYIHEAREKPVIAKKDAGDSIRNGEIYYRYGGRTDKISFPELNNIIHRRMEKMNQEWIDLMAKVAKVGPANAAVLDTEKGVIQKGTGQTLLIDEELIPKIKFIREGDFDEKKGKTTLKLVGDVKQVGTVEVTKIQKKSLLELYPLSFSELMAQVRARVPGIKMPAIFQSIKDNGLKSNHDYSAYNFRNRQQEDNYKKSGVVPSGAPSIYNQDAVEFLVKVLRNQQP